MNRQTGHRLSAVLLLAGCLSFGAEVSPEGKAYFTRSNIWYERPDSIQSTNYHVGDILPAATRVKILSMGKDRISFSVEGKGDFTISHNTRHNRMTLGELFEQYFTAEDPVGPEAKFHSFTKEEQKHIVQGTLAAGMCKEAVLMAYGYPPNHKTPKLDENTWVYWTGRSQSHDVVFDKDGKVKSF
jgi:hypothetical protein